MAWYQWVGVVFVMLIGATICLPALRPRATAADRWRAVRLGLPLLLLAATAIVDGVTPLSRTKNFVVAGIYWVGLGWIGAHLWRALQAMAKGK